MFKTVHVSESVDAPGVDTGASHIRIFIVYPSPSSGKFDAAVELDRSASIRLQLISLSRGIILDNKMLNGQEKYAVPYNENLSSGAYILFLETASSRRSFKIIIY